MSEQPEFFTYSRDEFMDEFVHPDDRAAVAEQKPPPPGEIIGACSGPAGA